MFRRAKPMFEVCITGAFGIIRWPVWTAIAYAIFATFIYLSLGYGWELIDNLSAWDPFFSKAFSLILFVSLVRCLGGYVLGRLVGRFGRHLIQRARD